MRAVFLWPLFWEVSVLIVEGLGLSQERLVRTYCPAGCLRVNPGSFVQGVHFCDSVDETVRNHGRLAFGRPAACARVAAH